MAPEQGNNQAQVPVSNEPEDIFKKEPFNAGVEANEQEDPKKFIQQLAGKLGQSLRDYTKSQNGQPDFDLEKFAINSVISATHTSEMDEEDKNDIIKKINKAGEPKEEVPVANQEQPQQDNQEPEGNAEEPEMEESVEIGNDSDDKILDELVNDLMKTTPKKEEPKENKSSRRYKPYRIN